METSGGSHTNRWELGDWIYWMVLDILESGRWTVCYRFTYFDKKHERLVASVLPRRGGGKRYIPVDAFVNLQRHTIFIHPERSEDPGLCLFHECMEILFFDWKDCYFLPRRWGMKKQDDPILFLESATWDRLTPERRDRISSFLPFSRGE